MPRILTFGGLALLAVVGLLWLTGGLEGAFGWITAAQKAAQGRMADAIRALRAGSPGALVAFWTVCLGYGVLHAAGPGHGKLVIGGYGVARRVSALRLSMLALAASLAQAAVAVVLVYLALALLGFGRTSVEGVAETWMTPVGHGLIAALGLWLVWRGARGLQLSPVAKGHQGHDHPHAHPHAHPHDHAHDDHDDHHTHGPHCTHAHGPTVEEAEKVTSWRDAAVLIGGIAIRPCSGALFVLILTWQLGIAVAGVIGAFVMGLGTALVTVAAALLAVWAREGAFAGFGSERLSRFLPFVELAVGALIAIAALGLLAGAL